MIQNEWDQSFGGNLKTRVFRLCRDHGPHTDPGLLQQMKQKELINVQLGEEKSTWEFSVENNTGAEKASETVREISVIK